MVIWFYNLVFVYTVSFWKFVYVKAQSERIFLFVPFLECSFQASCDTLEIELFSHILYHEGTQSYITYCKTEWKLFYNKVKIWRHISKFQEKLLVIFKYLKSSLCSILIFITHTKDPTIAYFCSESLAIALGKRQ